MVRAGPLDVTDGSQDRQPLETCPASYGARVRPLVLASASPARRELLERAGVRPTPRPSAVDEDAVERAARAADPGLDAAGLVVELARAKGEHVASSWPQEDDAPVVVACDSVLEVGGAVVGKPHEPHVAVERWRQMRGGEGVLHTGQWVRDLATGATTSAAASTRLRFAELSDDEIEAYVATGEPLEVAGAFTIDGLGSPFVEVLEGDHGTVIGLSLPLLRRMLLELGVGWFEVVSH